MTIPNNLFEVQFPHALMFQLEEHLGNNRGV